MAVERRVKPSTRMKQQLAENRKPVLIGICALVAVVVAVCAVIFVPPFVGELMGKDPQKDPNPDSSMTGGEGVNQEAIKAMLAGSVNYEGEWVVDEQNRFQVYLPGDKAVENDGLKSIMVRNNEGTTYAYGVTISDEQLPTLGGDPTLDSGTVLKSVIDKCLNDVSLSFYGAGFNGSYDMSTFSLSDGSKALRVDGELQTSMVLQNEGSSTTNTVTMNFPLCGFIAVRDDYPVFIWGVVDPDDGNASSSLEDNILDCATIFSAVTGNKGQQ